MAASLVESLRQGTKGAAYDGMLIGARNWGFNLKDIQFPKIYAWHGELDKHVPIARIRALVKTLPHCKTKYYSDDAHISTLVNHPEEIVKILTAESSAQ
jgi:hypothetical protein